LYFSNGLIFKSTRITKYYCKQPFTYSLQANPATHRTLARSAG